MIVLEKNQEVCILINFHIEKTYSNFLYYQPTIQIRPSYIRINISR
jgi:hypothetical protein